MNSQLEKKRKNLRERFSTLRELIFGLEDGIVSTSGAVIGIAAGTGNHKVVILSGIVVIVVEALSMAAGTYLSSKSNRQMLERMIREEKKDIEEEPEAEEQQLRGIYKKRGYSDEEINVIVGRIVKDKELWLEEVVSKELGIGTKQLKNSRVGAVVMWAAYTAGGLVPIVPFLFLGIQPAILIAFLSGLVALFVLGAWKAKITGTNILIGALEMMAISATAGIVGYLIGRIVGTLTGVEVTV